MNDLIERLLAGPQPDRHSGVIMEEAADEIERLRQCLKYEQHRAERIGTHGQGCWAWGPGHYECAMREIEALQKDAARYRWLLDTCVSELDDGTLRLQYLADFENYNDLNASLDAAMERGEE